MTSAKETDWKDTEPDPGTSGPILHGGDLTAARARFGEPPAPWLDLSTGINPFSYPLPELSAACWTRLPDRAALLSLEAVAGRAFGITGAAEVVAAPGTQALIQLLPLCLNVRSVAIVGFTYQEHGKVWRDLGVPVAELGSLAEAMDTHADLTVVVNPNNPCGRRYDGATLADLAIRLAERGGILVVDEAFADLEGDDASLVPHLPAGRALVLRSFGKTYGLAGLRLGFCIGARDLIEGFRARLGPWAVSGPALEIGRIAYADAGWRAAMAADLAAIAEQLDGLMASVGFEALGGTRLFRLYGHDEAFGWYDRLGRAGILVRPFPARPRWLRLGLPGCAEAFERLAAALRG